MRTNSIAIVLLLAGIALAGCANNNTSTSTTTSSSSTTTSSSTTSTTTLPTTPTTPAMNGTATITAVYVVSAPVSLTAGTPGKVCWRVEGSGTAAHVAVHTDTV